MRISSLFVYSDRLLGYRAYRKSIFSTTLSTTCEVFAIANTYTVSLDQHGVQSMLAKSPCQIGSSRSNIKTSPVPRVCDLSEPITRKAAHNRSDQQSPRDPKYAFPCFSLSSESENADLHSRKHHGTIHASTVYRVGRFLHDFKAPLNHESAWQPGIQANTPQPGFKRGSRETCVISRVVPQQDLNG